MYKQSEIQLKISRSPWLQTPSAENILFFDSVFSKPVDGIVKLSIQYLQTNLLVCVLFFLRFHTIPEARILDTDLKTWIAAFKTEF